MYVWTAVDGATVVGSVNCKCATDAGVEASSLRRTHQTLGEGVAAAIGHEVLDFI
jgi:hypothetical protein